MIKITLILLILTIASKGALQMSANSMNPFEQFIASRKNEYPTRVYVFAAIFILLCIATIISAMITVARW